MPAVCWAAHEYDKLPPRPADEQPLTPFAYPRRRIGTAVGRCAPSRGHHRELLALRFYAPTTIVPEPGVPLFASGAEAAEHGKAGIDNPSIEARAAVDRLVRKYDRIRVGSETA
jgi:hypothetical protein